jgi:hypothetical protein
MFVLLASFILSFLGASLNNVPDTRQKSKKDSMIFRDKYLHNLKILSGTVDSFKCLASYTNALAKLKLATRVSLDESSVKLMTPDDEAIEALTDFTTDCPKTYANSDCKGVAEPLLTTPLKAQATNFESKCLVTAAADDEADCYDAYDALVKLIEEQDTERQKLSLKESPADEFKVFVTKCLKTAQAGTCYNSIKAISPDAVEYADLADFKTACSIDKPSPAGKTDASLFGKSINYQIFCSLCSVIGLYFML